MLTFLSKGLFSAIVALVRLSPLRAKERCIIRTPGFEERPRPTELNGLPSRRTDGCGKALMEITQNKTLSENSLPGYDKRTWGYLGNVWSLVCSANYKVAKK